MRVKTGRQNECGIRGLRRSEWRSLGNCERIFEGKEKASCIYEEVVNVLDDNTDNSDLDDPYAKKT